MKVSLGVIVAALSRNMVAEGSLLRDVVTDQKAQNSVETQLLAKAVPLEAYRANLRASGYDVVRREEAARDLEQNNNYDDDYYMNEIYMYNFTGYSLKYATCQPVQRFSEDAISAGEYTPMVTDDIVVLRLCPSYSCSAMRVFGCFSNYAEYALTVNDYIRIMLRHKMDKEQQLCNYCNYCSNQRKLEENNNQDQNQNGNDQQDQNQQDGQQQDNNQDDQGDDAMDNDGDQAEGNNDYWAYDDAIYDGYDICYDYKTYCYNNNASICEDNGDDDDANAYLDTEGYLDYMECTHVNGYYIRPRCDGYQETIRMAIFYDPFCSQYAGDKVNMNTLGLGISPDIFQDFYTDSVCIDCSENYYPPTFNADANLCNRMIYSGASCTSNLDYDIFGTNSSSKESACTFIESIRHGAYDEEGRLYNEGSEITYRQVTGGQKWGISLSFAIVAILAIYSCYLHHSITNLLIRSLSHTDLLPPSRSRPRSRSSKQRSRSGRRSSTEKTTDDEWNDVKKVPRHGSSSRSNRHR